MRVRKGMSSIVRWLMAGYRDLQVWQEARILASEVYHIADQLPSHEKYGLCDQMRRAVASIGSNIAEGQGRGTRRDYLHFLYIARGSAYELDTQLLYCLDLYLPKDPLLASALKRVGSIQWMINQMIRRLSMDTSRISSCHEERIPYGEMTMQEEHNLPEGLTF